MKDNPLEDLFDESLTDEQIQALDFEGPKVESLITTLPSIFKIRNVEDIRKLEEFSAINYGRGLRLYRGHESKTYKLDSSLTRLFRKTRCTAMDVVEAEKKAFEMFCDEVDKYFFKWFEHKLNKSDKDLFIMSIGRHLGLPCRLIDVTSSLEMAVWIAVMNPKKIDEDGEIIMIVLDKDKIKHKNVSPFRASGVCFAHEPFKADDLDELPLGEQRRFIQSGSFLYVGNKDLLSEETIIKEFASVVRHYIIPHECKLNLAQSLYRDIYSGCAYQSAINKIIRTITPNP